MRLEVNEEKITENVSEDDLNALTFEQTVCVLSSDEHYLQLWIDEESGPNEFHLCPQGGDPVFCAAPDQPDPEQCREYFKSFLKGDNEWAKAFEWEDASTAEAEEELSEHLWQGYPCQFEDDVIGLVVYDHGVSKIIDDFEINQFVSIKVRLKTPDEDGFADENEEEILDQLEDELANAIFELDGILVGHITFEGERHFCSYSDATAIAIGGLLEQLQKKFGFEMEFTLEPDPEKRNYWERLYPPEEGLNLILDTNLVHMREEQGDHLQAPRLVEFWIDFPSESSLAQFETWAQGQEFQANRQAAPEAEGDPFSIVISKEMPIELPNVHAVSSQIFTKVKELEGDYVGWDCGIISAV